MAGNRLSTSELYLLANMARHKLLTAAQVGHQDHDLRILVGHANLLDSLTEMLNHEHMYMHSTVYIENNERVGEVNEYTEVLSIVTVDYDHEDFQRDLDHDVLGFPSVVSSDLVPCFNT
ncbi:HDL319Wp [Eremothecium sinecaudum]|uniref:HDL319Wp n=1 Tax=Eremothecium sinecaudum TaxID=45286 RepID=A0A0X8HS20_9SACH|nr:HDL319Wp [Eremothecium sinecaudum]AMD20425.1 HDL319Wp [Eremothecium sinecaudum]